MPEGSSSAAPDVKPGPSALNIRLGVRDDRLAPFMDQRLRWKRKSRARAPDSRRQEFCVHNFREFSCVDARGAPFLRPFACGFAVALQNVQASWRVPCVDPCACDAQATSIREQPPSRAEMRLPYHEAGQHRNVLPIPQRCPSALQQYDARAFP